MLVVLVLAVVLAVFVIPGGWGYALVVPAALLAVAQTMLARSTRRLPPRVGVETMIGQGAVVVSSLRPWGRVRYGGESWQARCAEGTGAAVGDAVTIVAVDRMTLVVSPVRSTPGVTAELETPMSGDRRVGAAGIEPATPRV